MQGKKSLKANSILNVIKTISSIVFPIITFPYISRVLGPENVGKVNFGSSFISYFTLIASLGITTYAIRECSVVRENKKQLDKTASELFSINVCTTLIAYALLGLFLLLFRKLDSYRTLIIIQSTVILFATWGADWINSAIEDFKYITIRTVLFQIISLILIFVFVREQEDYLKYAIISVISSSGANLANVFYRRKYCDVHFTFKMRLNVHFKPIMLLFVMILAQTIFNSVDITMLGLMKGDFEIGIYSTAFKIKNIIAQVVSSLAWVVMPRMSYYFMENDYEKINLMLKKVLGVMLTIGFPLVSGSISLSNEIIQMIGGAEYTDATMPLIILMVSFAIDLFGGSFLGNMVCLPSKNEHVFMQACCIAAIINVILNYILIPFGGAWAAAFTTMISALVIMIWLIIKKDKRIKLNYLCEVVISPLIGSVFIFIYCSAVKLIFNELLVTVVFSVMGSMLIYSLVMLIMKNSIFIDVLETIKRKVKRK